MGSGRATTVGRNPHVVCWRFVARVALAWLREVHAASAVREWTWPRGVLLGEVDATVVPWVASSVEAPSRFDRDQ